MVMVAFCLALVLVRATQPDQVAFVQGAEPAARRVCVADLASGAVTPVGPGTSDGAPVWAPGGEWLAFDTGNNGGRAICVVHGDGSGLRRLPLADRSNRWPRWSPEGTRIAYASGAGQDQRIMVYDLGTDTELPWGGNRTGLMRPVWVGGISLVRLQQAFGDDPALPELAWQPDANIVAIGLTVSSAGLSTDLFIVTPDGAIPIPGMLLPSEGSYEEWFAEPAPDGKMIAFESNDGGDREIFVLYRQGAYDVSNHRAADWNPVWSPDGKCFAFESFRSGRRGLYRAYPDTVRVTAIAASPEADFWHPAWSPDGAHLAFVSNCGGAPRIFIAESTGENMRPLTNGAGHEYAPAWRPTPEVKE
ncbi:MAG TPA: hypothetical protein HPP77_09030 [Candidatus Hydrogenedentes bacterium]|nr:hypothetical protein [Candidatus Hydrogenedentota bacterium]HIJ73344.1 hypothetical protein [Candidatus Hydrogenedentota bacterium]